MQLMVEVRVPNLDCEGCASKCKRALFKLKGNPFFSFCLKKKMVPGVIGLQAHLLICGFSFPCKRDLVSINVALVLAIGRQQSACIDAYMHPSF